MANKKSTKISGVRKRTHESVDKIIDKTESLRKSSKETIASLKEKARRINKKVGRYIRLNPKKAVLIAAGVGAIVGTVITAARKK